MSEIKNRVRFLTAAYWPKNQVYGGFFEFDRENDAMTKKQQLESLGYKTVHVWKEEITRII